MRRPVIALSVAAGLLCAAGVSAAATAPVPPAVPSTPATSPFKSANVTHVGTVPLDGAGVSMEVRQVGGKSLAYVSGAGGLSIYDATNPKAPELLGHLPIYNWENEDIAVSKDGKKAFLSEFTADAYLHAVDTSNPALPVLADTLLRSGPHTVVCANDPCDYLYGSGGEIFDVRDVKDIKEVPATTAKGWGEQVKATGSIHNLHRDEAGVWTADSTPIVMFEQVGGDPLKLRRVGGATARTVGVQHNNIRVDANAYVPRDRVPGPDGKPTLNTDPALRPGELLLNNGETNFTRTCSKGQNGSFSTWSLANFDKGQPLKPLYTLEPLSGTYTNGDPALNGLGCSGHWFTEKDAADGSVLVTAAWYEHGTRFLKVNKTTGEIKQVGFFQSVRGATSEAFWMPGAGNVVWAIDYHSGIDILEFSETAPAPTTEQTDASWLVKAKVKDPLAVIARELCKAGADMTTTGYTAEHAAMHKSIEPLARATFRDLASLRG